MTAVTKLILRAQLGQSYNTFVRRKGGLSVQEARFHPDLSDLRLVLGWEFIDYPTLARL